MTEQDETRHQSKRHELRNELNTATLAIHLSQKQIQIKRLEDAEESLMMAIQALSRLSALIDETEIKDA